MSRGVVSIHHHHRWNGIDHVANLTLGTADRVFARRIHEPGCSTCRYRLCFYTRQREKAPAELSASFCLLLGVNGVLESNRKYRDPKESLSVAFAKSPLYIGGFFFCPQSR